MKHGPWIALLCVLTGCARPAAPATVVRRVVIISVDGLRADLVLRASTPNMRALMRTGSFTLFARSTDIAWTLPTHVTMLTGVSPRTHGIWWDMNEYTPPNPLVPTLFEVAKKAGYTTAMAVGKRKLDVMVRGGPDWVYLPDGYADDLVVAKHAVTFIEQHQPQVLMVHFPDVDAGGHGSGWGSPQQLKRVATADRAVGMVVAALKRKGLYESTAIILTADHGGAAHTHGGEDPRSQTIPWIIVGPGIRRDYDMDRGGGRIVRVEDTFATACYLLKIPMSDNVEGRPAYRAMESNPDPFEQQDDTQDRAEPEAVEQSAVW